MSMTNTGWMHRRPTHPGEMLREDFLPDYGLSAQAIKDEVERIKPLKVAESVPD